MLNAAIIHVPEDASTIQSGLELLSPGDTILLAMGTYPEALEAPPIAFAILGDVPVDSGDFPRPVIDASLIGDPAQQYCLNLPLGAAATIERIRFGNHADDRGVSFEAHNAVFRNCAFDSLFGGIYQDHHADPAIVVLDHCLFQRYSSSVFLPVSAVNAQACQFRDVSGGAWQLVCGAFSNIDNCVFVNAALTSVTNWGQPVTIRNCVFTEIDDSTSYAYVDLSEFSGEFKNNLFAGLRLRDIGLQIGADCTGEVVIQDNTFFNCHRVNLPGAPGPLVHLRCDTMGTAGYLFEHNLIYACTTSGVSKGLWAENRGLVYQNHVHDLIGAFGSLAPAVYAQNSDSMLFRENIFYHNGRAMNVEQSEIVDARWNYWGDATGPHHESENPEGLGDTVLGAVIVDPWYSDTSFLDLSDVHAPLPDHFELDAYPNPFNSTVTLKLIPPEAMIVSVELFDVLGRKVQEIWDGPIAFEKRITFDGSRLASGIYFARTWQPIGNRPLALTKLVLMK